MLHLALRRHLGHLALRRHLGQLAMPGQRIMLIIVDGPPRSFRVQRGDTVFGHLALEDDLYPWLWSRPQELVSGRLPARSSRTVLLHLTGRLGPEAAADTLLHSHPSTPAPSAPAPSASPDGEFIEGANALLALRGEAESEQRGDRPAQRLSTSQSGECWGAWLGLLCVT